MGKRIYPKWILAIILWLLSLGSGFIFAVTLVGVGLTGTAGWNEGMTLIFSAVMALGFIFAGAVCAFGKFDNP